MTKNRFNELLHKSRTYNDIESRVELGKLPMEEYWALFGGYPYNNDND